MYNCHLTLLIVFVLVLTLERLEAFIPLMLSKMHIESLVHGNANKEVYNFI